DEHLAGGHAAAVERAAIPQEAADDLERADAADRAGGATGERAGVDQLCAAGGVVELVGARAEVGDADVKARGVVTGKRGAVAEVDRAPAVDPEDLGGPVQAVNACAVIVDATGQAEGGARIDQVDVAVVTGTGQHNGAG